MELFMWKEDVESLLKTGNLPKGKDWPTILLDSAQYAAILDNSFPGKGMSFDLSPQERVAQLLWDASESGNLLLVDCETDENGRPIRLCGQRLPVTAAVGEAHEVTKPTAAQPKPIALGHDQKEAQKGQAQDLKPAGEKRHIFISHAGEDAEIADRLANDLRERGYETILDRKHLKPGDDMIDFMRQGIANAHTVIILHSKHTPSAKWQQKEINIAVCSEMECSGGKCIAAKLDDSPMDPMLVSKKYMTLDMSDSVAYEKLLEDLCAAISPQKTAASTALEASQPESANPTA